MLPDHVTCFIIIDFTSAGPKFEKIIQFTNDTWKENVLQLNEIGDAWTTL